MKKPIALIIMDGFGIAPKYGNAIDYARTPHLDQLFFQNPVTMIGASGLDVGLPHGQMGNSEVGHTNMGAGRIVYQELTRITKSIEDGDFFENEAMNKAIDNCKANDSSLHPTARRTTAPCICSVCSPPAAFTATTPICTAS